MFKKFGIVLGSLIVALLAYIALVMPANFKIERKATIKASPAQVAALITDFHAWADWSPWAKLDPNMKTTYSGPASGVGAVYEWAGDDKVGSGKMTIADVKPDALVGVTLQFLAPYAATNRCEFELAPGDGEVLLTWRMTGERNFGMKAASLVMNLDQMVGGDFDRGLSTLKVLAEIAAARAATPPPTPAPEAASDAGEAAAQPDAGAP